MTKGDKERYRVQAAIAAMQGILASPGMPDTIARHALSSGLNVTQCMSKTAVMYADALMAELGLGDEE